MPEESAPEDHQAKRLTADALTTLVALTSGAVAGPAYQRDLRGGIVHLGVGGFHRAHLATYMHELAAAGNTAWGIVGAGVLAGDQAMAAALHPQNNLYSLITRGPEATDVQVIGSLVEYLHAHPDSTELQSRIASPDTQIVSLTITEGGYPIDDLTGNYLPESKNAGSAGAFGILALGLDQRRTGCGLPLTVLSCDNIMSNGRAAEASLLGEAAAISADLSNWIEANVSFPNSMVDRITPATVDADRAWLQDTHGIVDAWPVVAEPFRQWVIEDEFAGERPPLEQLDIILTDDVEPYEFMKLRLLNAGHSCLAYLAALDDIETVDAAMADPSIREYVATFLQHESKPVLPAVAGVDVDVYIDSLIERFSNPQIGDQISRLCLDGTAKFPKFLLPTVRAQLAQDGPVELSALALAAWCIYLNGASLSGQAITVSSDPLLEKAIEFAAKSILDPAAFLSFGEVFDDDLPQSERFRAAFVDALAHLHADGVRSAIDAAIKGTTKTE